MNIPENPLTPTTALAMRVRELRQQREWSAAQLAAKMQAVGLPWQRLTVTQLEIGQRKSVTVDELVALARVFGVRPEVLVIPPWPSPHWDGLDNDPNDQAPYQLTPAETVPVYRARQWWRGHRPLPRMNPWVFHTEVPPQDQPDQIWLDSQINPERDDPE